MRWRSSSRSRSPRPKRRASTSSSGRAATGRRAAWRSRSRWRPSATRTFDDNGGATADGVTGDEITVVLYLPDPDDPILDLVAGPLGIDADPASIEATYRGYGELFEASYELYGRRVRFEPLRASGFSNDEVAARADAVRAADDLGAFVVVGRAVPDHGVGRRAGRPPRRVPWLQHRRRAPAGSRHTLPTHTG